MQRRGRPIGVAVLLLAAASVSLLLALRDVAPLWSRAPAPRGMTAAGSPSEDLVAAPALPPGAEGRLHEQVAILRQGLAAYAARGGAGGEPRRGRSAARLPLVVAGLSGLLLGLGLALPLRFLRARGDRPQGRTEAAATTRSAGAPGEVPPPADFPNLAGWEPRRPARETSAASLARGGLLPWSDEARRPPAAESELSRQLRSMERMLLLLTQKMDAFTEGAFGMGRAGAERPMRADTAEAARMSIETAEDDFEEDRLPEAEPGSEAKDESLGEEADARGTARLAGFAHALVQARGSAEEEEPPTPERVRQAIQRLAREGWSEERIARRLWLDPAAVSRVRHEGAQLSAVRRDGA